MQPIRAWFLVVAVLSLSCVPVTRVSPGPFYTVIVKNQSPVALVLIKVQWGQNDQVELGSADPGQSRSESYVSTPIGEVVMSWRRKDGTRTHVPVDVTGIISNRASGQVIFTVRDENTVEVTVQPRQTPRAVKE